MVKLDEKGVYTWNVTKEQKIWLGQKGQVWKDIKEEEKCEKKKAWTKTIEHKVKPRGMKEQEQNKKEKKVSSTVLKV